MPPTASFVTALRERVTEALQIRAALQYDNVMAWRGEFWLGDKNARIGPPFLQGETATLCLPALEISPGGRASKAHAA
jgi:hypothetical protein